MKMIKTGKEAIQSILDLTRSLLEKYGARIPGTKGSVDAAGAIVRIMGPFCDRAYAEEFTMHPGSLFNIGRAVSLIYVLSVALLFMGGVFVYVSLGLCVLGFAYAVIHYFLYGKCFDRFFRKRPGCNAVGVIEPAGEAKQQIIVSGHHDSPYVFNYLSRFERLAGTRFLLAMVFYLFITILSIVASLHGILYGPVWQLRDIGLILALIGLVFLLPLFFFISTKASPGAGDNLNGSSIALHIGKYFAGGKENTPALEHTRLILLSTDGEEAGQRGAIAYVRRHKQALAAIPTYVLNFDSIYTIKDLAVLLRDRHGFLPLSAQLAEECMEIGAGLGYTLKAIPAPFGSGTDAAAFAKEGIEATTFIGMPTSMFAKEYIYHTLRDTVDRIEPEAVEAVFNIAVNYIVRRDQGIQREE
jgi:aminopeptidase YwaD